MQDDPEFAPSILSHGERAVARALREGRSVEEIAAERDESPETVEKSVERIRAKTDRALATLVQSPFTAETARDLPEESRARLREALDDEYTDGRTS